MSTENSSALDAVVHNALESVEKKQAEQAQAAKEKKENKHPAPHPAGNRAARRAHLQHKQALYSDEEEHSAQKQGEKRQGNDTRNDRGDRGRNEGRRKPAHRSERDGEPRRDRYRERPQTSFDDDRGGRPRRERGNRGDKDSRGYQGDRRGNRGNNDRRGAGRANRDNRDNRGGRGGYQSRSKSDFRKPEFKPTPFVLEEAFPVVEGKVSFADLPLDHKLLHAIHDLGFTHPTPVQEQSVPAAYNDGEPRDLMVSSRTGSGKTAAFLLPVLQSMLTRNDGAADKAPKQNNRRRKFTPAQPDALVLCPTRELAQQVAQDAIALCKYVRNIRIACVVGGMAYGRQLQALNGARLVIATPGRLLDLYDNGQIETQNIRHLILDEADRMLDMGFADDLEALNEATEAREQTLMFSATFEPRIQKLARDMMRDPIQLTLASAQEQHDNITQRLHWADSQKHKQRLLEHWLRDTAIEQAIVFAATKRECDMLATLLQSDGFRAEALHGDMKQGQRNRTLRGLREGHIRYLIATDVAARGIDVPTITHVFNFGLPMKAEDYVHRIGRTGRAGRDGTAVTFATFAERKKIRDIERYTKQTIETAEIEGLEPVGKLSDFKRGGGKNGKGGGGGRRRSRHNSSGYAARKGGGGGARGERRGGRDGGGRGNGGGRGRR